MAAVAGCMQLVSCTSESGDGVFEVEMNSGWRLFSSSSVEVGGDAISRVDFNKETGFPVEIPATVLSGLIQNGQYQDIYFNKQLEQVDKSLFQVPWWYRCDFNIKKTGKEIFHQIILEGINYKANLWINGQKVAGDDVMEGSFGIYNFDVGKYLVNGNNAMAIEIIPPVRGDLILGFVDWNPEAPDRNMGLWRGVKLKTTGTVSVAHSNVVSTVDETLQQANLLISAFVTNHSDAEQQFNLLAEFNGEVYSKKVTLDPGQEKEVFFAPDEFPSLNVKKPKLWWPNNMGEAFLHNLTVKAVVDNNVSDAQKIRFGIRQIKDFRTEEGHRGFMVNGQKVLIRGGGWVDDMLLADSDEKVKAQVDYVRHMNLNAIRLEGFWGKNNTLYERCDEQGILLMIGWSCQWEWESYCGRPDGPYMSIYEHEYEREAGAFRQQVLRARHHPSVFLWTYGSDRLPHPDLETILNRHMAEIDPARPVVTTCRGVEVGGHFNTSTISGPPGVKMLGPYDWVSPNYWYNDTNYGGAYGFNTETGPGPQVPPIESIKRMLPEKNWWPMDSMWNYHLGRNEFATLNRFLRAFNPRYGEVATLEEFAFKNQISNYEAIRGMFEAFAVNKFESTGVIQWMLNSAWPEMYWQLYDYYLMPNGAFYGTKKAAAPLMAIYNYKDKNIYVNNDRLQAAQNHSLVVTVYDINSKIVYSGRQEFSASPNSAALIHEMPKINGLSTTYFLDLRILDSSKKEVANNFYWLSTVDDVQDFENTTWVYTPNKAFADLTGINTLNRTWVDLKVEKVVTEGKVNFTCELNNASGLLAFFIELRIVDSATGQSVLPVFWDDNYVSLAPGEKRVIKGWVSSEGIDPEKLKVVIKGQNLEN